MGLFFVFDVTGVEFNRNCAFYLLLNVSECGLWEVISAWIVIARECWALMCIK